MTNNSSETVRAIRIHEPGGSEVLKVEEITIPRPGPDEALVRIQAAGLNFIDIYRRRGTYPVDLPYTPGLEAAGVVQEIGSAVTEVKPGDRVAYTGQPGAYAQASLVKADRLIPLPDDMSFEDGAAFPLQGLTAHYLINEFRKIRPDMTVLIHAAAGGMGLLLTQWAKHLRAVVIGTVSTAEKAKTARDNGCDYVINYTEQDFVTEIAKITGNKGVELVIDGVGKDTFSGDVAAVSVRGTIVIFGSASGRAKPISPNELQAKSISVCGGSLQNFILTRDELLTRSADVLQAVSDGWLRLTVNHKFELNEVQQAHELLETRRSTGKIILDTRN